jgi:hypothetical protein
MGAPPGSKNAQKEATPADSFLYLRVTKQRKSAYVRAAQPEKLTEWATRHLDAAADYTPRPT